MRRALAACAALLCACGPSSSGRDTGLDAFELTDVAPGLVLPGTKLVLSGTSFVDHDLGASRLAFDGFLAQAPVRFTVPATYASSTRLEVAADQAFIDAVGGRLEGTLAGTFAVEVRSEVDAAVHRTPGVSTSLELRSESTPQLGRIVDGVTWVNQPIEVDGAGFLLGGKEGTLSVRLVGCFQPDGQPDCGPPIDVTLPATPAGELDRTRASFGYGTQISGIGPGHFSGQAALLNQHAGGLVLTSSVANVAFDVQRPRITGASTTGASLGQYVLVDGGGFVGGSDDESTVLSLVGTFVDRQGLTVPLDLVLIPEFVSGPRLRYVLDENDPLGKLVDLRKRAGTISGTVQATVQKGATKLAGDPIPVTLQILPIKQVIYVDFKNYYTSLHYFGLRAADDLVRRRVIATTRRIFSTVNVEFRDAVPTDFAVYSTVDISGPDPSGRGDFGYDNTPGKDVANVRLFDRIGGVNATTQADGYAGFGGIFTESFFAFSAHPNGLAKQGDVAPLFDEIFDPFRPDVDGSEVTASELAALAPPELTSGDGCPAAHDDRRMQIACAVWTLGSLVGSTMAHEVGHSLGLADPYGPPKSYHNNGDLPDRLMEVGPARPFDERAILGAGPAEFCQTEYEYLRDILRSDDAATTIARQPCD